MGVQLADARQSFGLVIISDQFCVFSALAEGRLAIREAAQLGLPSAPIAQPLDHHAPFKLGEDADHLPHRRAHG